MPRRNLVRQNQYPYHVTTRTNNKTWFEIPLIKVWSLCKESFLYAQKKNKATLHCFVLMNNHYHLLLSTPESNIDVFMKNFNYKLSQLINKESGVINHKFSNRYKWSIVSEQGYLLNVYRYIYQNPVRAKMTMDCLSYPFSSLHFSEFEKERFSYEPHISYEKERSWLERQYGEEFEGYIRKGLKKKFFTPSKKISTHYREALNFPF